MQLTTQHMRIRARQPASRRPLPQRREPLLLTNVLSCQEYARPSPSTTVLAVADISARRSASLGYCGTRGEPNVYEPAPHGTNANQEQTEGADPRPRRSTTSSGDGGTRGSPTPSHMVIHVTVRARTAATISEYDLVVAVRERDPADPTNSHNKCTHSTTRSRQLRTSRATTKHN